MKPLSDNELHAIIGRIYDSVAEPQTLNDVLGRVAGQFDAHSAVLFTPTLPPECGGLCVLHNHDPAAIQRYCDHYFALDLWWQAGRERAVGGEIVTGAELVAREVFERSEFYNDFLEPTDTYHVIATDIPVLAAPHRVDVSLAFHGRRRHPGFGTREKAALQILAPTCAGPCSSRPGLPAPSRASGSPSTRSRGSATVSCCWPPTAGCCT